MWKLGRAASHSRAGGSRVFRGRGALGWGLGDGGARGRGRRGPRSVWECLEFERKAPAGPRRTLAGFLTGLWQYVFAGLGLLAALN